MSKSFKSDQASSPSHGENIETTIDGTCEKNDQYQTYNFKLHLTIQFFIKLADELASAKVAFPWILSLLGAPLAVIGLCVPLREAGVLLPQLLVAARLQLKALRKYTWALGCLITSLSLLASGAALIVDVDKPMKIGLIFICLLLFSLSRGVCSVTSKDVLGKTVPKNRRGKLIGIATSLSGALTLTVGLALNQMPNVNSSEFILALLLAGAGFCWLISSMGTLLINESESPIKTDPKGFSGTFRELKRLIKDTQLRNFVVVRALLLSAPLSLPIVVVMAQQSGAQLGTVGLLIIASGCANLFSGYFWGKLADRSSRKLLIICATLLFVINIGISFLTNVRREPALEAAAYIMAYFGLSVILAGIRTGRKTLLIDMSNASNRAYYVAISNTAIGILILALGAASAFVAAENPKIILYIFAVVAALAATFATTLLREIN